MTNLEIALSVAEVVTLASLLRIYRKHMIVRHLFIRFSDWTAQKIDEMSESASWEIMDRQKTVYQEQGHPITDDEARDWVPDTITHAKREWGDHVDHFQATLKHNGMSPLDDFDLSTPILNPKLYGFKFLPEPRDRFHASLDAFRAIKTPTGD